MPGTYFLSPKQYKSGNSSSKKYTVLNIWDQSKQSKQTWTSQKTNNCRWQMSFYFIQMFWIKTVTKKSKTRLDKVIAKPTIICL